MTAKQAMAEFNTLFELATKIKGKLVLASGDAIDQELASTRRKTAVKSLREAPELEAFRQALGDALVRVDTANQVLRLVNTILSQIWRVM